MKKILFSAILMVAFTTVSTAKEIKTANKLEIKSSIKKVGDCSAAGRAAFTAVFDITRNFDTAHAAADKVRAACRGGR